VRTDRGVTIGIGPARANAPEPGQLWTLLDRWLPDGSPRCLQRAKAWARRVKDKFVEVPLKPEPPLAPGSTDQTLLQAVLDQPASLERRQIYADLLLEKGDPRGELIHVQL